MLYRARTRKRVHAIRRTPDGSAFQKCESCGLSVAIALADMHECESNDNVKRRKRVHAIRRAPDGSSFQKCESCGLSVAIALADMHECESNDNVKRFKGGSLIRPNFEDQPRSAFRFFMEEYVKICKEDDGIAIDRQGFEMWKKMSQEERQQYVIEAEKVDLSHTKALLREENDFPWMDDEADSAEVWKFDEGEMASKPP